MLQSPLEITICATITIWTIYHGVREVRLCRKKKKLFTCNPPIGSISFSEAPPRSRNATWNVALSLSPNSPKLSLLSTSQFLKIALNSFFRTHISVKVCCEVLGLFVASWFCPFFSRSQAKKNQPKLSGSAIATFSPFFCFFEPLGKKTELNKKRTTKTS